MIALEEGNAELSRPQLLKMAKVYRRPLIAFYLVEPPAAAPRIEDYRTLRDPAPPRDEANLAALVRDVRARQDLVRDVLQDEDTPPVAICGAGNRRDGVVAIRDLVARQLDWSIDRFRAAPTIDKAFDYLRQQVEAAGVYVLLIGDLGNYVTAFDVETFRGFALTDRFAPFVVINDQDARSAWAFTLLHELAHIAIGASGVSGRTLEGDIERFCNDVASSLLLPEAELAQLALAGMDREAKKAAIGVFARARRISRALVTYRLFRAQVLTEAEWNAISAEFLEEYRRDRADRKAAADKGAPDYYTVRRHRLGAALISTVRRAIADGSLTHVHAARVLGVAPRNVGPLLTGRAA
jgi:Zn-dependent peptidase ImmA (M78 family)